MKHTAWAMAALVALTACTQGYQGGGEEGLYLHYDMTLDETLAAMHRVGQSLPGGGLQHKLLAGCTLQWREGGDVRAAWLHGVESRLEKLPEVEHYRVVLDAAAPAHSVLSTTVVSNAPWAEATQMKWLLDYAHRFC